MDKVLPAIEMPKIEPEEQQIIPDSGDIGDREMISELLDESNDNEENISHDIIDVEEREIPEEDEVFDDPPPPSVKPLKEPEFSELPNSSLESALCCSLLGISLAARILQPRLDRV